MYLKKFINDFFYINLHHFNVYIIEPFNVKGTHFLKTFLLRALCKSSQYL